MSRPARLGSHGERRTRVAGSRALLRATLCAAALLLVPGSSLAKPLPGPGVGDTSARPELNRWDAELASRKAVLAKLPSKDAASILPLLGLLDEVQSDVDPQALDKLLSGVARASKRHPLVRSYASFLQARILESRGDLEGAAEQLSEQGYVLGWQIVGPFENANRKGEGAVYAPQTEAFTPDQTFRGKLPAEPLAWRVIDYTDAPRGGYVSFDDRLRPNTDVTGYATAWVWSAKAQSAAIHVGTGGPYEVWVDGAEAGSGSAYRVAHPLQESHAAALQAGWNRVLVKVSAQAGMWGFFLRVSQPGGAPIPGLKTSASAPEGWDASTSGERSTGKIASLREVLETRMPQGASDGVTRAHGERLVEFYRHTHPFDREDDTAVRVAARVEKASPSSQAHWLRALVDRDEGESLQALHRGIDAARTEGEGSRRLLAKMLLELAWRQRSMGLDDRFRENLEEAHAAAPSDPIVELALLEEAANRGLRWWALRWLEGLVERNPHSRSLRLDYASRLHALGRTKDALAVLGNSATSSDLAGASIDALLELGRADDAVELARRAAETTPGLPERHVAVARLEESRGDKMAARSAWARALALAPHDADLHAELGRVLVRSGELGAATGSLRRSLELRPQQPDVRDLLASLDASAPDDVFARYGLDLAEESKAKVPASWKGKDAAILHHRVAVKVLPNGLTERLDHRVIRILDDRGVRSQAVQGMSYDPAESLVEVRRARVRRADGTVEELGEVGVVALASAGYRMYYDQRQVRVAFGGLRVGDTLEVAFLRRDVAARNMFDQYFGDLMALQGSEPIRKVDYILEAPTDKPIFFNLAGVKRTTSKDEQVTLYRYEAKNVKAIQPEGGMPGWTEIASYLHASTYRTWNDVGDWYWDLVREQLVVDASVKKAVADATAGLGPDANNRDKVHAIYEYVVRNTRYVGLEFGIHGYKPYRTTEVLSRRFGDCKDKASLLKVMLEEVGIEANLVLVRTRDQGVIPEVPASLAVFNHAITYVPEFDLFLDGTAEWSGPTELPASDQGASVLIVKDGKGAEFRTIAVSEAKENARVVTQDVTLAASGSAKVAHQVELQGAAASSIRFQFQSAEQRVERMTRGMGSIFPGVSVSDVKAPDIGDINQPARLSASLEVPQWGAKAGDGLRFKVTGRDSSLTGALAGKSDREYPLVLDVPMQESYRMRYRLPRGYRFATIPAPATVESAVGRFTLRVTTSEDGAEVETSLVLPQQRISPEQYPEFRKFLRSVDAKLEQNFEMVPAK